MTSPNNFTDFFNAFMLPTSILDNNFNTLCTYKYEANIKNSAYTSKAIEILKTYDFVPGIISIDILNNIKYTSIQFYHYDNKPMYILIGPYIIKNTSENNTNDILCIDKNNLDNAIKIYTLILENNSIIYPFNKNKSPCVCRAIEYIEKNYTNEISIDELCKELNINKCYFCNIFKKETGYTFINYLNNYKIEKSKKLLKNQNLSLLDIAIAVGFNNQSYYSTVFKKITNKTPLEFRESILKP